MFQPLGYLDFMKLVTKSLFVMTDSGGIQEETTFLNIPCLTLRNNTERPITLEAGSNRLVGRDVELIKGCVSDIVARNIELPEVSEGDYIVIHDTGGYTFGMWSKYVSRLFPKVIALENNTSFVIRNRGTKNDIYNYLNKESKKS